MFSFFKNKGGKAATVVHADVGAPLVPQSRFPAAKPSAALDCTPRQLALEGVPPQASLLEAPKHGETTTAYLVEGSAGQPRLAFVNVREASGAMRVELWELGPGNQPVFARKRPVRLDPRQDSWPVYLLKGVACLPANRFLLAISYDDPYPTQSLFVYDSASGSSTKLADVKPYADNLDQVFDAQLVAPDAVIAHYFTGTIRLAADVYYNTPSHLRLFTPRYPQGIDLVRLAAGDGSVRRWAVIDRTLWIDALDYREKHKPKQLYWSLSLENTLPR